MSYRCLTEMCFVWFKRFREGHESLKMIQGMGGCQLHRMQKRLYKFVNYWPGSVEWPQKLLENHLNINQEKICQVLRENMGNRKSCMKILAHSVKDEPKEQRGTAWDNFTETCQNSARSLGCIITGDEWIPDISVVMKRNVRSWSDWRNYQWAPTNYAYKIWVLKVCWSLF
jgi:hypothetical protein